MLFSEHPRIKIPEAHTETPDAAASASQERLDEILSAGDVYATLLEASEICSAMGGIFLKVNWDKGLASWPILSIAQPDAALPEFRFGILTGCTFWKRKRIRTQYGAWLNGTNRASYSAVCTKGRKTSSEINTTCNTGPTPQIHRRRSRPGSRA